MFALAERANQDYFLSRISLSFCESSFMLNGYNIYSLDGFDTLLSENDVVAILPPVGGG